MSTSSELETKILEDFLHYFLPEGLLDYFEPVMAEDKEHQIKQDEVYKRILHLYFDERDNRPAELQHLRPNGFTEEKVISGFLGWEHRSHADNWVLLPDNLGPHLSIDESCLHDDLFTIVTNKDGHGRTGTVVAMVRGTKAEDVIKVLMLIPETPRSGLRS